MSVDNRTPFPAIAFRQYNLAGDLNGVLAVRGTFRLTRKGPLTLADKQAPLVMADTYDGDPHETPQMAQTDLVPFKPGTDVTLIGFAFSPDNKPRQSFECGLRVGPVGKRLRVHGPRKWRTRSREVSRGLFRRSKETVFDGWELGSQQAVTKVPLDWRLAYGGAETNRAAEDEPESPFSFNPIGLGAIGEKAAAQNTEDEFPAHQIEAVEAPAQKPFEKARPHGFGPISPWWRTRHQYAGTYDDEWLEKRHPLLPRDFDFRFWQCAHPDLIAEPWLAGDERFELENLLENYPVVSGQLPNIRLEMTIDQGGGVAARGSLVLDGVHFDLRPGIWKVYLTWRIGFPWPERRGLPCLQVSPSGETKQ